MRAGIVMVVAFLALACASGPRPSGGSGETHPLAFHGREVDRQACHLEGQMEGEDLPVEFGDAEYRFHFELTGWPGMLAIRLRDGFVGMSFPDGRATITRSVIDRLGVMRGYHAIGVRPTRTYPGPLRER